MPPKTNQENIQMTLVRKATSPSVSIAREKLALMRLTNFIGIEQQIFGLSQIYDRLVIKYTGKVWYSLPFSPKAAKASKNWKAFRRLYETIELHEFSPELFIEIQFKKLRSGYKVAKLLYPVPNMLYGQWAIENYMWYVKDHIEKGTTDELRKTETDFIREVLTSSFIIVKSLVKTFPEVPQWFHIMSVEDSLSPIYLATNQTYLKYANEYMDEIPEEVMRALTRLTNDYKFKKTVNDIMKELQNE